MYDTSLLEDAGVWENFYIRYEGGKARKLEQLGSCIVFLVGTTKVGRDLRNLSTFLWKTEDEEELV